MKQRFEVHNFGAGIRTA